jgi:hypothetical protein
LRAALADVRLDRAVVVAFVASRVLLILAAVIGKAIVPEGFVVAASERGPIVESLTLWDGAYYLAIARDGYHAEPIFGAYRDTAFAPLYPILIRILSTPWPAWSGLVAVLISNVALLAALGLLTTLGSIHIGRERASRAAVLLAIFPFAWVFGMAYSESLFLLLAVAAFLAAERGHRAAAGILLALAVLTRLPGVVLIVPMAVLVFRQDGWRVRASQAWLLVAVCAAVGFVLFVGAITGSPSGYLDAMVAWGKSGLGGAAVPALAAEVTISAYQVALLVTLLASIFLLVFSRVDRIPPAYVLIPIVCISTAVASGSLESIGRYTVVAFPLVWILANRDGWFGRRVWPWVSAGLFTLTATLSFGGLWVP